MSYILARIKGFLFYEIPESFDFPRRLEEQVWMEDGG